MSNDFAFASIVPTANRHRLPNADRAIVEIAKQQDYCLNPNHEDGKHKARVFASALGIRQSDAEWLRKLFLLAATEEDATALGETRFGTLYVLDFPVRILSAQRSLEAAGSYSSLKAFRG